MTAITDIPTSRETTTRHSVLPALLPFLGVFALAMILPFVSNDYWALIGTRAAIYWVLVAGLNLVVGFAGHLAIGYVALLTLRRLHDQRARCRQRVAARARSMAR